MSPDPLFEGDDDANTPLGPTERRGLIPSYITTRAELNAAEQAAIEAADHWAFARRRRTTIVDIDALTTLHRRMLRPVWKWAGEIRETELNIGVAPHEIVVDLRQLVDDVRYWIRQASYPVDEIAIRFHHRLVAIHAFANGNGRHARMAADLLAVELGAARFTWGSESLIEPAQTRRDYVAALQAADGHDIAPLLAFSRR